MSARFQEIKDLIAQNKLDDAAVACCELDENFGIGIRRELKSVQAQVISGLLESSDQRKAYNRISWRILEFLDSMISPNGSDNSTTQEDISHIINYIDDISDAFIQKIEQYLMNNDHVPTNRKEHNIPLLAYYLLDEKAMKVKHFEAHLEKFKPGIMEEKENLLELTGDMQDHLHDLQSILETAELETHNITDVVTDCRNQCLLLREEIIRALSGESDIETIIVRAQVLFNRLRAQLEEKKKIASTFKFSDS